MATSEDRLTKRISTFRHLNSTLISKRVSIIMSNPVGAKELTRAVRVLLRDSGE